MKLFGKKNRHFLAMWDMYGLEGLYDLTHHMQLHEQWEKEKMWSVLKGEGHALPPAGPSLPIMILRARMNSQRRYEIYEFMSDIEFKKIKSLFKDDPDFIMDFVRTNGHKIYSDYESYIKQ